MCVGVALDVTDKNDVVTAIMPVFVAAFEMRGGADGGLYGMTANSFTSVSLTPPLVLWSASLYAQSLPAFQEDSHSVVNVLAWDQIELSNKFARTHEN